MVQLALQRLQDESVVDLDEERKATVVSSLLGWKPRTSREEGLRKTIAWFRGQLACRQRPPYGSTDGGLSGPELSPDAPPTALRPTSAAPHRAVIDWVTDSLVLPEEPRSLTAERRGGWLFASDGGRAFRRR